MKNTYWCVLMLLIFLFSYCSSTESYDLRSYVCPKIEGQDILFYEYDNQNFVLNTMKFMSIEKDSTYSNVFIYTFYDKKLNPITSIAERRGNYNYVEYIESVIYEKDTENNVGLTRNKLENIKVNYSQKIGSEYSYTTQWNSKFFIGDRHKHTITRRLAEVYKAYPFQDETISSIKYEGNETLESGNNQSPINTKIDYKVELTYGENIGLLEISFEYDNGQVETLKLGTMKKYTNWQEIEESLGNSRQKDIKI